MNAFSKGWLQATGVMAVLTSALVTEARAEVSHSADDVKLATFTARAGSSVGYADVAKQRWSTLGAQVAIGYRIGPLAVEGEYETNKLLYYTGLDNDLRGGVRRIGVSARFYALAFNASRNRRSHIRLFVDAAIGKQFGILEGRRFERRDAGGGMGILVDHRVARPDLGIQRLGWQLGWRVTGTPRADNSMARIVCIAQQPCALPPESDGDIDMALALGSSLMLSW